MQVDDYWLNKVHFILILSNYESTELLLLLLWDEKIE